MHLTAGGGNSNGIRKTVAELTYAQAALGHQVLVHLSGPDRFDDYPEAAVELRPETLNSPLAGPRAFGFSPAGERWVDSPGAAACSVLHQHGIWPAYSRITRRWRATYRRPTVVAPHGSLQRVALDYSPWKKRLALAAYERSNLRDASCLHATAEEEIIGFRDFGLRNPVAVIPNGASDRWLDSAGDARRFRVRHRLPPTAPMLLYMSRVHRKKNLLGLIEAMGRMGEGLNDWHLTIGGPTVDADYHARAVEAIRAHGLESRIHWVGELQGQDKRDAFAMARLFVLPTLADNFAIVVVEALGAGVPVITTHGALPWSLLETHKCGWWVPLTTSHLVRALKQAIEMPPERLASMGRRGRVLVEERFRWIDAARQSTQVYRWLLGQGEQPDFVVID